LAPQTGALTELTADDAHALVDAARLISSSAGRSLDETLDALSAEVRRLLDADGAAIVLATGIPDVYRRELETGIARRVGTTGQKAADAFVREAIATGGPLVTTDFQGDPRLDPAVKRAHPAVRVGMTVPLQADGAVVGLLFVHWARVFTPTRRDLLVAEALGRHAAVAIGSARAIDAERQARAEAEAATARAALAHELLCTLVDAAADAQVAADEQELYDTIGQAVIRAGLSAHLDVVDQARGVLVVRHVALVGEWLSRLERMLGRPAAGIEIPIDTIPQYRTVVHERRAVLDRDAWSWMRACVPWMPPPAARAIARLLRLRHAIAAPIVDGGEVIGVLSVWGETLSEDDLPTIELLGRLAGGAIEGHRLRAAEAARAEEAQRARAELEAVMDAAADAILVFTADGRLLRANPRAQGTIGRLLGDVPATTSTLHQAAEPRRPDGSQSSLDTFQRALRGEPIEEVLSWRTPDGRNQQLHVVATPIRGADGRVWGVVVVARDVGIVREVIGEPARVEGAVLTARLVAHELNTKLQLVTGYGSLLQREAADPRMRELVDRMVDGAEEAATIVARLQQIIRVAVTDVGGGPMLDLEAATASPR
jgi:PAS domain S-box-containing protein